ncbi:hypothetical protein CDD81_122 [Ophiocordyceps australis]|uniref:Structure-specific endonuclease subunit SLX4 n=1 Tax=Ophiocordyceps australis TaxID=1399860 RepID=A0A2C5YCW3_9HYPO|nr:hypothetical protein CDD81_122 [Ophiocordyceps australis]
MATPDAFMSSPARGTRNPSLAASTSSPDLPSLHELLARNPKQPVLKSGSNAVSIPENATAAFASAGTLWKSLCHNDAAPSNVVEVAENTDAPVIQDTRGKNTTRSTKPAKNRGHKTTPEPDAEEPCSPLSKDQPWRKFKSPSKAKGDTTAEPCQFAGIITVSSSPFGKAVHSHYFQTPETPTRSRTEIPQHKAQDEALNLEPAMNRRLSWTPPVPGSVVILDSDDGPADSSGSRQGHSVSQGTFGSILAPFRCCENLQQSTLVNSDESSANGKKRKSIEPTPGIGIHVPDSPRATSKPPPRKKAVRKNPQTVTALATAAYRSAIQVDDSCQDAELVQVAEVKTAKGQPRKRAAKPRGKKKNLPAKPMLLSPTAALRQVARQDFIFGTSSQLVRSESPSLPRNLEASRRPSSQLDQVDLETPINSDALESVERRRTLWDAGARDEDGELFDFELNNMPDGSRQRVQESDPFGYMRGHDEAFLLPHLAAHSNGDTEDLFVPVVAPRVSPRREATNVQKNCIAANPLTAIGVEADPHELAVPHMPARANQDQTLEAALQVVPKVTRAAPSGSSYDLFSDAQLSKQIADYGFKPIKRRTAMIALLEQCQQGKSAATPQGIRSASTLAKEMPKVASRARPGMTESKTKEKEAKASRARDKKPKTCKPKDKEAKRSKTIGRQPRKPHGDDGAKIQEPPPSAQPIPGPEEVSRSDLESNGPETRKKRRPGRRAKPSLAQDGAVQKQVPANQQSETRGAKKRAGRGGKDATPSPPRKTRLALKSRRQELESLEDEFEEMLDLELDQVDSSWWSESTFSDSGPCDLSLTMDEDTTVLHQSSSEQQAMLFRYMSKAVTSAPRTNDAANPSWHDKILLYDPIVIEDLAAWLNSGQLTRVGCDDEVSLDEVKKWCEKKSVCCLWRLNLRRQERRRL